MKEIMNTALHMVNARSSLVEAALSLQKVKPNTFDTTIKETKEMIGDLSCSISVLEDFLGESDG